MADVESAQVTIRLSTQLPAKYRVAAHPLAVPARLTRHGLSEVVNSLLKLATPVPFDFLINDELVQTALETFIVQRGISAESVLSVEYIPAVGPLTPQCEGAHPDWISSLSGAWSGALLSGCYDGVARLWGSDGRALGELHGHTAAVTCVAARPSEDGTGAALLLTGSKDGNARAWSASSAAGGGVTTCALAVMRGHTEGVAAVAASPDGQRCATGGWDSSLRLWRIDATAALMADVWGKRRKKGAAAAQAEAAAPEAGTLAADAQLSGHSGAVSALCWPEAGTLYSGGWDHTLRAWDVETGACARHLNDGGSKAVFSMDCRAGAPLLAFCGAERAVRVWDTRADSTVAQTALASHAGWVAAVRWCPWQETQLISCGHDGTVKVWDLRGAVPLQTSAMGDAKLLAADFLRAPPGAGAAARRVCAGGEDARLHIMGAKPLLGHM